MGFMCLHPQAHSILSLSMERVKMSQNSADLEQLLAKQALHDLNVRYCRAVDRLDRELMDSLWAPGATVDVGVFEGAADAYSEMITQPTEAMIRSFHAITNELYQIDGEQAWGEVYVTAAITVIEEGERIERLVGGRYLDRFVKANQQWCFQHRFFVLDWSKSFASEDVWNEGLYQFFSHRGSRDHTDLSHSVLKQGLF